MEEERKKEKNMLMPASILIAGVLIAGSVIYSTGKVSIQKEKLTGSLLQEPSPENVKEITKEDHIRGSAKADVKIIEFSDFECPFCKQFHETMKKVMDEYEGKAAWVYRHSPIDQLHSKARKEAEASECAAKLGGNETFWKYADRIFELTPSNDGLDLSLLPQIAEETGLDKEKFSSCLEKGETAEKVQADVENAAASGGGGTPYSVVITKSGKKYAIPGALPFEGRPGQDMKSVIEAALEQ